MSICTYCAFPLLHNNKKVKITNSKNNKYLISITYDITINLLFPYKLCNAELLPWPNSFTQKKRKKIPSNYCKNCLHKLLLLLPISIPSFLVTQRNTTYDYHFCFLFLKFVLMASISSSISNVFRGFHEKM